MLEAPGAPLPELRQPIGSLHESQRRRKRQGRHGYQWVHCMPGRRGREGLEARLQKSLRQAAARKKEWRGAQAGEQHKNRSHLERVAFGG